MAPGWAAKSGRFGDRRQFSLYPTKNLGALGDGGVSRPDAGLADRLGAAAIWLANGTTCLRRGRRQQPARRSPGGDPAGEAAPPRRRQRAPRAIAARLRCGAGGPRDPHRRRAARGPTHVFHQYVVRHPTATACRRAATPGRHRHGHPLPGAGDLQPAYAGRVAIGAAPVRESERTAARGAQPADVSGADGGAGVGSLRSVPARQLSLAAPAQWRAKSRSCQTTRPNRMNLRIPFWV